MKKFLLLLLICHFGWAAETPTEKHRFELGVGLHYLVPSQLPSFDRPLNAFSLMAGIPMASDVLVFQGSYGGSEIISLTLVEVYYQLNIPNPFFTGFALGGAHYIHYGYQNDDHTLYGPVAGFGFYLPFAKNFRMGMNMKFYLTEKLMLSFGGAFAFFL